MGGIHNPSSQPLPVCVCPCLQLESLGSVEEVLYSSSGALYNLSRHPGNRQLLYRLELEVRTRGALADVAADVAAR